jgi:hypothetical protein
MGIIGLQGPFTISSFIEIIIERRDLVFRKI